ncbi:MAG: hypothetical protein R3C56_34845 [Pirellulaceae bacterium]|jgi:hypothetical protein
MMKHVLKQLLQLSIKPLVATAVCGLIPALANAQICGPAYSVQRQQVMEEQFETRMRVIYETEYVDQQVVTNRAVPKTRMETRQYTVSKPVVETSTVEERYTVMRPVTTREYVDQSYNETSYVTETAEREESRTTYRPVTETQYQTQNYVVQRPVVETQYQTQSHTTYQPVTTYQTATVDQGQYYVQQYQQPGDTRYGLRYLPGGYNTTPTGVNAYRRGGFGWVPYTSPSSSFAQLQYRPNPVQVAVPQTTLMPQVQQIQVPVQVTKMQSEVVQQQVPYNVTRYEPVQETRKVPYSVQRPVTRHIERKVPVDKTEWVEQEMVRPKTVQRTSYKLETITKEVPVQYYETEAVTTTVKVPRQVARYEPYTIRRLVPRTVQSPVVLSYSDPYSVPLSLGQSSWLPTTGSSSNVAPPVGTSREKVTYGEPRPASESSASDPSSASGDSSNMRKTLKVETVPSDNELPEKKSSDNGSGSQELELNPSSDNAPQA